MLDEPQRKGFAFGTLAGHPVSGEVAFILERSLDETVWFTLRSLSGPGKGLWWITYPIVLLLRGRFRNSYLQALAEPLDLLEAGDNGSHGHGSWEPQDAPGRRTALRQVRRPGAPGDIAWFVAVCVDGNLSFGPLPGHRTHRSGGVMDPLSATA